MTDKLEPLRELTPEENKVFAERREIGSVVQHRCAKCGAWYETAKRSTEFQEAFLCDCGQPMTFTVPAISFHTVATKALDLDDRLDTGMRVREAIASACYWWNKTGRRLMKGAGGGRNPFSSLDPSNPDNFMPSAIVNGEPWDQLEDREKLLITKAWHNEFVRGRDLPSTQQKGK